ncbi:MAG: hypothetical protein M9958_04885 [Chitinophagales bacterium]|nr:hypothetical protein [Chitinophagales bacterium]
MRVLGVIPHQFLKITVFGMNMKYSVKIEMGQMEITYKIRESESIKSFDDIDKLIDEQFLNENLSHFTTMFNSMEKAFERHTSSTEPS